MISIVRSTLSIVRSALSIIRSGLSIVQSTLSIVRSTLSIVWRGLFIVRNGLFIVRSGGYHVWIASSAASRFLAMTVIMIYIVRRGLFIVRRGLSIVRRGGAGQPLYHLGRMGYSRLFTRCRRVKTGIAGGWPGRTRLGNRLPYEALMTTDEMLRLSGTHLAPYMQVATILIGKTREGGGNMFRHQLDTMTILIDYGYIESVLLKAAIVHDVIEDVPDFNHNTLLAIDYESPHVYELVLEVSRRAGETKPDFLTRIRERGSRNAKILKVADRISNMISLGFVNKTEFVKRYTEETVKYIFPIAEDVDKAMFSELTTLVASRKKYLKRW
jgi:hypothetical protein